MIINTYDQMKQASALPEQKDKWLVAITFTGADHGRGGHAAHWQVVAFKNGEAYTTDPDAAWYNHKRKTFTIWKDTRAEALAKALAWAQEKYGIDPAEYGGNRTRDQVPKWINKQFPIERR